MPLNVALDEAQIRHVHAVEGGELAGHALDAMLRVIGLRNSGASLSIARGRRAGGWRRHGRLALGLSLAECVLFGMGVIYSYFSLIGVPIAQALLGNQGVSLLSQIHRHSHDRPESPR